MRIRLTLTAAFALAALGASAAAAKPLPQPVDPDVGQFVWIAQPDWMKIQLTLQEYVGKSPGSALIECTMHDGRPKDCKVIEETPAGRNYGRAAVAIAALYKASGKDSLGEPIEGRVIRMPVEVKAPR